MEMQIPTLGCGGALQKTWLWPLEWFKARGSQICFLCECLPSVSSVCHEQRTLLCIHLTPPKTSWEKRRGIFCLIIFNQCCEGKRWLHQTPLIQNSTQNHKPKLSAYIHVWLLSFTVDISFFKAVFYIIASSEWLASHTHCSRSEAWQRL